MLDISSRARKAIEKALESLPLQFAKRQVELTLIHGIVADGAVAVIAQNRFQERWQHRGGLLEARKPIVRERFRVARRSMR
jgi:hypothetical protein